MTTERTFNVMGIRKTLSSRNLDSDENAMFVKTLCDILVTSDEPNDGHHSDANITPTEFRKLLGHWKVTPSDFGLNRYGVYRMLSGILNNNGYSDLTDGLSAA